MLRWLKISLKIILVLLLVIAVAWIGGAYYIRKNNKAILAKILSEVNTKISGDLKVSHMETSFLKGFPGISVSLKNVSLTDSLWHKHQHKLLSAKDIDVTLNALSLLIGTVNIRKVAINNAKVYLYTDSNGYSNTTMFGGNKEKQVSDTTNSKSPLQIRNINFNKVDLIIDNRNRSKLFSFYVEELKGKIKYPSGRWDGDFKINTQIRSFAFNTKKGSFLKDKSIVGHMKAHYDENAEIVMIDQRPISIGGDIFNIGANINIARGNSAFTIALQADQILYKNVAKLLAPNISVKLLKFAVEKPVDITGSITDDGSKNSSDPLITVKMVVKKNKVTIPYGDLTDCNFVGYFSNKDTTNRPIGDPNSIIRFYNLNANFYNAPIKVDTFTIANLEKPIAQGLVTSKFNLENLNHAFEDDTFSFEKGTADIRLFCQADIDNFLFTKPLIHGKVEIKNANITYLPRKLKLNNSSLNLNFNQTDLNIANSRIQLGKSIMTVNCSVENFLNFYYTDPAKIEIKANLTSPFLQLNEFISFLEPRNVKSKKTSTQHSLKGASAQLNTVLEAAKVELNLKVDKAVYNKFIARNVTASVVLKGNTAYLNKIDVLHAGGRAAINGTITQMATVNKMKLNAKISNVNIKEFFYAFDNFGQQSVTNKNLLGRISARINANGNITTKGNIVPKSMNGKVDFTLNNAALVGFEPLENIGKFIFRSRNLSHVKLEKLNGTLKIRGDKVDISPMKINSTALNFNIKGVYGFNEGTDIQFDVPLRDPKKSKDIIDKEERDLARMKGIVLHLKAVDEDGKIKIKWNSKRDRE